MDIAALVPAFGGGIVTLIAFVIALSIIVFVHEYGHYIVGRWSGIKAEVFSIGFGPVLLRRTDRHGTVWQVAAIPLGGFVKFLGDANAASGKDDAAIDALPADQQRHTMHGAPLWARAATVAAGPVANFLFAIMVFSIYAWIYGVATGAPVVGEVRAVPGHEQALQPGDRVLALAGQEVSDLAGLSSIAADLGPLDRVDWTLERDGQRLTVAGPHPLPPLVDAVQPMSAAAEAGMLAGDLVLAIDGRPVRNFEEMREIVGASDGRSLVLRVLRAGAEIDVTLTPQRRDLPRAEGGFETRWLIGLNGGLVFVPEIRGAGVLEGLHLGALRTWDAVALSLSGLWHIVFGQISSCNLSGPLGMAEMAGEAAKAGVEVFFGWLAMLSVGIGLMNLFPIPVLDGGHLVFHAWEAVTGKPPSERAFRILMTAGLALILTLMAFALSNDLFCP